MSNLRVLPAPSARHSAALKRAIDIRIRTGASIAEACREAGLSMAGCHKAMKRPAVREHLQKMQSALVAEVEGQRVWARARAIEVAVNLIENAKSEAIRARMREFLAADAKAIPIVVHVDARTFDPPGYIYRRPGERLVDLLDEGGS
jgi:hypothetical protein